MPFQPLSCYCYEVEGGAGGKKGRGVILSSLSATKKKEKKGKIQVYTSGTLSANRKERNRKKAHVTMDIANTRQGRKGGRGKGERTG